MECCCAGVELMPFHVTNGSLPELTEAQWIKLMKATMKGHDAADKVSAILLTEPHFTQVCNQPAGLAGASNMTCA